MRIPEALRPEIESLLAEYLAVPAFTNADYREFARKHGALPIFEDWVTVTLLRTDGTFIFIDTEHEPGRILHGDEKWEIAALVQAAERHSRLRQFIPQRPSAAPLCGFCSGEGWIQPKNIASRLLCGECGGLGWLPPGTAPAAAV